MAIGSLRPPSLSIYLLLSAVLVGSTLADAHARKFTKSVAMSPMMGDRVMGIRCGINGSKPIYNCVIDSGASNTLVSDRILRPAGPLRHVVTGGGTIPVYEQRVSFQLTDGLDVRLIAYVQMMMVDGIDVLIGQDLLRHFKSVAFDYGRRQIIFEE